MRRASLLLVTVFTAAIVANAGPWWPRKPGGGGDCHSVPEPASIVLLGGGLAALGIIAKRKKK